MWKGTRPNSLELEGFEWFVSLIVGVGLFEKGEIEVVLFLFY
jgi:hypothetical protein